MDGFALAQLDIDIARFADEGIITEGDRITEKVIELADGERFPVKLERCADAHQVRYRDPLTGHDVVLPATHARRWALRYRAHAANISTMIPCSWARSTSTAMH